MGNGRKERKTDRKTGSKRPALTARLKDVR